MFSQLSMPNRRATRTRSRLFNILLNNPTSTDTEMYDDEESKSVELMDMSQLSSHSSETNSQRSSISQTSYIPATEPSDLTLAALDDDEPYMPTIIEPYREYHRRPTELSTGKKVLVSLRKMVRLQF